MGSADASTGDREPDDLPPLPDEADGVTVSLKRFCRLFPGAADIPASGASDDAACPFSDESVCPSSEESGCDGGGVDESGCDEVGPGDEAGSEG